MTNMETVSPGQPEDNRSDRLTAKQRRAQICAESIESQLEDYGGKEKWQNDHVTREEDKVAYEVVTKALRSTRGLRFAACFGDPNTLGIPRQWLSDIRTQKKPITDYKLPLESVLVHPEKISESFAESIGLMDRSRYVGDRTGRLEHLASLSTIAQLKRFFETLTPCSTDQTRFCRVPENEVLAPWLTGTVVHFRENAANDRSKRGLRKMVVSHFTSGYSAYRKTLHEGSNYDLEIKKLATIESKLAVLIPKLDKDWFTMKEALMQQAPDEVSKCARLVQNAIVILKRTAHSQLEAAATLEDKRGRVNVTVAMTKITAARNNLEKRFKSIENTGSYNDRDSRNFRKDLLKQEDIFDSYISHLDDAVANLERFAPFFDRPGGRDEELVKELEAQLELSPENELPEITLRPFVTFKTLLTKAYTQFQSELAAGTKADAISAIERLQEIGRLYRVNTALERLNTVLAHNGSTSEHASRVVEDALEALKGRKESLIYEDLFLKLDKKLALIAGVVDDAAGKELDKETADEIDELIDSTLVEPELVGYMYE